MIIDYNDSARECSCEQRGHLEAYASASAVVKRTQEALDAGRASSLTKRIAAGEALQQHPLEADREPVGRRRNSGRLHRFVGDPPAGGNEIRTAGPPPRAKTLGPVLEKSLNRVVPISDRPMLKDQKLPLSNFVFQLTCGFSPRRQNSIRPMPSIP